MILSARPRFSLKAALLRPSSHCLFCFFSSCSSSSSGLVLGLSGCTCSGKTTIASRLAKAFPNAQCLRQDDFYFPDDSPRHQWVPELNFVNYDLPSAVDMDAFRREIHSFSAAHTFPKNGKHPPAFSGEESYMEKSNAAAEAKTESDLIDVLQDVKVPILILDGITIFNDKPTSLLCDVRYFCPLDRDECLARRNKRAYDPPDVPGYFEQVVWPQYLVNLSGVERLHPMEKNEIRYLDGTLSVEERTKIIASEVVKTAGLKHGQIIKAENNEGHPQIS